MEEGIEDETNKDGGEDYRDAKIMEWGILVEKNEDVEYWPIKDLLIKKLHIFIFELFGLRL